jgi:phage shock protein C
MYCNSCGKQIPETAKFCDGCGKAVTGATPNSGPSNAYQAPPNPYRGRLIRPQQGRKFKGVCLAVANYLDVDVTLIRIIWLVLLFGAGSGFIAYIIGWLCIDEEPEMLQA